MREKKASASYLYLFLVLFALASLPKKQVDAVRSVTIASLSPIWRGGAVCRTYLLDRPIGRNLGTDQTKEIHRLELENNRLRAEMQPLVQWIASEKSRDALSHFGKSEARYRPLPARVLYRDPSSWSSTLWVYVGEEDNQRLSKIAVGKNSPVLFGGSLLGVIDFVGKRQSRVRLITDSAVTPAVRVCRGKTENGRLALEVHALCAQLDKRKNLFVSAEEKNGCLSLLHLLETRLGEEAEDLLLAKGELQGSAAALWRARTPLLKGIGFNLDYGDREGPARELRTGRPLRAMTAREEPAVPLIQEGDLLITSGLDGVFPPGLFVATVASIGDLKEGGYAYEITALPAAKELNYLDMVFVLPPLSGEER